MNNINDYHYINEYIAKEFKKKRNQYGYSLADMGAKMNISRSRYCNYEMGIRGIPTDKYFDICKILNINAEKLFEDAQNYMREEIFKNAR